MYFIEETDKPKLLSKIFFIPVLQRDKIILPINCEDIIQNKNIEIKQKERNNRNEVKLAQKTKKILDKTHCKKVILSKKMQKREVFCNQLHTYGFEIINGRWLFSVLSSRVIEYVVKQNQMLEEKINISIMINDLNDIIIENIKQMVKKYKSINIVTNHIEKFKKIENQILEEYGIMITLNNNRKKSLTKSDIILNVDFPIELINRYTIAEKAIIINLKGNIKIKQKRFEGKVFNNYEIMHENLEDFEYDKTDKYFSKDIYEALIYKQQPIENIMKKIEKDKVKIIQLI